MKASKHFSLFRGIAIAVAAFVTLFVTGGGRAPASTTSQEPRPISLVFSYRRLLALEACGCSMRPLGGVVREANLLARWRTAGTSPSLALTGGGTFVPHPLEYNAKRVPEYRLRSRTLVHSLKALGVAVVVPQPEDALLGVPELTALSTSSGIPFVSTNLYDERGSSALFRTHLELRAGTLPILIMGLAASTEGGYPKAAGVTVVSPEEGLRRVFSALPPGERFVVVVTSLERAEQVRLQRMFPSINLWLGGPESRQPGRMDQLGVAALAFAPLEQGRELVRFDLAPPLSPKSLYGPTFAEGHRERRNQLETERTKLQRAIAKSKVPATRREYQSLLDANTADLERFRRYVLEPSPGASVFELRGFELEKDLETPVNELSAIVATGRKDLLKAGFSPD